MGRIRILNESGDTETGFTTSAELADVKALFDRYLAAGHLAFDHAKKRQAKAFGDLDVDSDVIIVPEIRVG